MSEKSKKHDWAQLDHYLNIHEKVLKKYQNYMESPRLYEKEWKSSDYLVLRCERMILTTHKQTIVRVDLIKEVQIKKIHQRDMAKTYDYTYSASIPKGNTLIRYCSPHRDKMAPNSPDHHAYHHKHDFTDVKEKLTKIEEDTHPHVSEFLDEVLSSFLKPFS